MRRNDVVKFSYIEGEHLNPDEVRSSTARKIWQRINRRPVNERQQLVINRMLNGFEGFLSTSKYAKLAQCSKDTKRALAIRDFVLPHGHRIDDGEELIGSHRRTAVKLHSTVFTNEPHPERWR